MLCHYNIVQLAVMKMSLLVNFNENWSGPYSVSPQEVCLSNEW